MTTTTETRTLRYHHSSDVLWRSVSEGVLLLVRSEGRLLSLIGSGSALWQVLSTPRSVHESAIALSRTYALAPEVIAKDIEPVLSELCAQGFLVAETAPA